ncbi:MAG: branched-chain amino acid ABC transporter substrate-binding protein [Thermodesulfovibrionales bacterium]|nr:branched-chain amino acid ABC transporter substrate-binding protein [Thermodesulfovibrionales bacterium]
MKKSAILLLSLLMLALIFYGCRKKEDVIKIGVAGPMTGDQAKMGTDFKNGVTLAVEEWNAKGGVLGKKIKIMVEDDQHEPKQAVSIANKIVNAGAVGIIGHFNSSCSIPASDVYNRAGIPMISPGSTNPKLTEKGYKGVFRVCGRDDQQGKVGAEFVINKLKLKKIAIIHDKTTYGQGLADEFKKFVAGKVEVVYYSGIIQGDKDFKTVLTAMKEKKPELIYFGGIYPEAGLIVRQAKELGINVPLMSGDGTIDPKFIEIAGAKAAEGTYLTFSPDARKIPTAKTFIDSYEKKYGEIGPYSMYAYDAANVMLTAIREAGTKDGKAIIEKLHSMEFNGAVGKIKFDEKGDVTVAPYVVWITKNGKFEEYWKP